MTSYIRACALMGFHELVEPLGGDGEALVLEAGIDPNALTDVDGLISFDKFANLLEIAAQRLSRPCLGLEYTLSCPPHFPTLGAMAMLGQFVSTGAEWVEMAQQYCRYYSNGFAMPLLRDENPNQVTMRYRTMSLGFPTRQLTECAMGNSVCLSRTVGNQPTLNPTVVRFQHSSPRDLSFHERAFRCPVEFNAEYDEVVFDPAFLALPTPGHLKFLKPMLGLYIKSRIRTLPLYDQSMATTVSLAIRVCLGTGKCNIDFIAASLGLSSKKLQRLLTGEGTTFSEILERERSDMARKLLLTSDAPIANIAGLLDYSTTAPFTQAFKRWTGMAPMEYRKSERLARPGGLPFQ